MVNINLIGDETNKESEYREENFAPTINLDPSDLDDEKRPYHPEISEFPSGSSGNARLYIIIAMLVLVVVVAIYMLFPRRDSPTPESSALTEPEAIESVIPDNANTAAGAGEESGTIASPNKSEVGRSGVSSPETRDAPPNAETAESRVNLSPIEKQMLVSTRMGEFTVNEIAGTIASGATLSLVRYSDNSFLAEFIADTPTMKENIMNSLRNNLLPAELKEISQEKFAAKGPSAVKVLVSGFMNSQTAPVNFGGRVRDIAIDEFVGNVRSGAASNRLTVKNLRQSTTVQEGAYELTPVEFTLQGTKEGAINFLDSIARMSPGIVLNKISLINNDPRAKSDDSVTLVVVLQHYAM